MLANALYDKAVAIVKSDTVNFDGTTTTAGTQPSGPPIACDAIFVGGAGVVVAVFQDGSTASFTCIAGQLLPVRAIRVNSTNTTASVMVALYAI